MTTTNNTGAAAKKMRIQIGAKYVSKVTGKVTTVLGVYTTEIHYAGDYGHIACTPAEFRAWFDRVVKA